MPYMTYFEIFFSSRRRHTRFDCDWSSDVCSSDLSAGRLAGGKALGRVDRGVELTQGLGADQQWIVEAAAVGEIDLDGAQFIAQAQLQIDHRALGHLGRSRLVGTFVGAVLDLADTRQTVLVKAVIGAIG